MGKDRGIILELRRSLCEIGPKFKYLYEYLGLLNTLT